ncbi:zinc finger protein Xfin [Patella vulgata]|uniref:zinc finger protein Xfin n=1 Tax=Patella vulgata TaxID=6465 RepID=UPI00217F40DA|nr:zinc finger protein Xfin [Patella vulgata]
MDTPYICTECGIGFKKETELKVHTIIHAAARELTCKECGIGFQNEVDLKAHIAAHSKEKVYPCSVCKNNFSEKKDLDAHFLTHSQSEIKSKPRQVYTCEHCGCSFNSLDESAKHICTVDTLVKKTGDSSEKDHVCKICGKAFASKYQLEKKHMLIHSSEKPYVCDVCGKGFIEKSRLKRHSYMHTTEKPFICQMCGRGFTVKKNLKAHEETHKPIDNVNSETNSSERSTPISTPLVAGHFGENVNGILTFIPDTNNMNTGMLQIAPTPESSEADYQMDNITTTNVTTALTVTPTPASVPVPEPVYLYSCTICQSQFEKQIDLEAHSLTHTGSIPKTNLFACQKCKISFSSQEKFEQHSCSAGGSKSPERRFACETCGKLFHQKYSVKKHMLTHSDKKPFVCEICGKGFIERSRLKRHSYTHTQERPYSCEKCGHGYLDRAKCKAHEASCKGPTMHTKINTIPTTKPATLLTPVSQTAVTSQSTAPVAVSVTPNINTMVETSSNLIQLQNVAPTSFIYTQADLNNLNNGAVALATTDMFTGNTINTVVLQGALGEHVLHGTLGEQIQHIIPMDMANHGETQSATELLTTITDKDGVAPVMNLIQDYFVDVPIYTNADGISHISTPLSTVSTDNHENSEINSLPVDQLPVDQSTEVSVIDSNLAPRQLTRMDHAKILFSNQLSENDLKVIMASGADKEFITLTEYPTEFPTYQYTDNNIGMIQPKSSLCLDEMPTNSNATIVNLEKVALPVTHIQTDQNGTTQYLNISVEDNKPHEPQTSEFQQFDPKDGMLMNGGYEFQDIYPEAMDTQNYEKNYDLQSTIETEMKTYAELSNVIVDKLCSESVKLQNQPSPVMPTMHMPMEIKHESPPPAENSVESSTVDQKILHTDDQDLSMPLPVTATPVPVTPPVPDKKDKNPPSEKSKVKVAAETDEDKPYSCDICGSKFIHHRSLLRHKGIHNNPYVCKLCGRHFSNKYDLEKKHMLTHTSETPFACHICDKAYKDKKRLRAHMTTHTGLEPFICPVCSKGFSEKKKMTLHISSDHPEIHLYSCPECKRGFPNKKALQNHISTAHKAKPFNCGECRKNFVSQAALTEHMKCHTGQQTVACEECHKEFTLESPYDKHLLLNTDQKRFICQICSQSFTDKSQFYVLGLMLEGKHNQNELQNGAAEVEPQNTNISGQLLPTS